MEKNRLTTVYWIYKETKIVVTTDGRFYFSFRGKDYLQESLDEAKSIIDDLMDYYYHFTKDDVNKMLKKLNEREQNFVKNLMKELNAHTFSAYCEIGISEQMLFRYDFNENYSD